MQDDTLEEVFQEIGIENLHNNSGFRKMLSPNKSKNVKSQDNPISIEMLEVSFILKIGLLTGSIGG